jgi:type IV pilus assembly protein PilY1
MRVLIFLMCALTVTVFPCQGHGAEPSMADYASYYSSVPPFITSAGVKPNVLIVLDNSGMMNNFAYDFNNESTSTGFDPSTSYFGYFDPAKWYTYSGSRFVQTGEKSRPKNADEWDGNFLNWLTMRRVDIARKVLVGGKADSRNFTGNPHILLGEQADDIKRGYRKEVSSAENYIPAAYSGTRCFVFNRGSSGVSTFDVNSQSGPCPACNKTNGCNLDRADTYNVRVQCPNANEPTGVIQMEGDKVRWGLEFFNANQGGKVITEIADNVVSSMVTAIENEQPADDAPLGEALWTATGYFAQDGTTSSTGPRYFKPNPQSYRVSADADPFNFGTGGQPNYVWCAKSFVLMITGGEPTMDRQIPPGIAGYYPPYTDGSGYVPSWADLSNPRNYFWSGTYNGTHYLDDVALYSRVDLSRNTYRDLRPDLPGDQYLTSYFVYVPFGNPSPDGRRVIKQAARNGGFEDRNGNFLPDLPEEYDKNNDGDPDTYFEANDGDQLAKALVAAITDILRRTSSGTAVSILSTSAHGEGSLFQAYFKPAEITSLGNQTDEAYWLGYLHGLWVDDHGNIREDDGDHKLIYQNDPIIGFYFDENNWTKVRRDYVSADFPYGDGVWDETNIALSDIRSLWEGGKKLALRDITDSGTPRKIYTSLDGHALMEVSPANASALKNYLRASTTAEAEAIIRFIRGEQVDGMRSRNLFIDTNGDTVADTEVVWRLGDIVYSTPAVVARPMENYDEIYSDKTYGRFETLYAKGSSSHPMPRPTVIYAGANDGMLHAFNAGCYRAGDDATTEVVEHGRFTEEYPDYFLSGLGHVPEIGEELWGYIPKNLLPHLRWLTDPNYSHVYYVDLTPKIVDARVFPDDPTHPDGWGTVLIGGLGLGGGTYEVDDFNMDGHGGDQATFSSCYFALDITNPGLPQLLWEFNDPTRLGFTTSYPAVARTGNRDERGSWYVIFGSGPTNYYGDSTQKASLYVLNLLDGTLLRRFELDSNAFIGGVASLDLNLDYNVNAVYFGASFFASNKWKAKMYRLLVGTPRDGYPSPASWAASVLASTKDNQVITAAPGLGADNDNTPWVYWGTGRFLSERDKPSYPAGSTGYNVMCKSTQTFYGVKDRTVSSGRAAENKTIADLFDVTPVRVTYQNDTLSTVSNSPVPLDENNSWQSMLKEMRADQSKVGWMLDVVDIAGTDAGERVLEKPSVFGGLTMFTSYKPVDDICGFGGDGMLYGVYYETGTPFRLPIFTLTPPTPGDRIQRSLDLGMGRPSSLAIHVGQEAGGKIYVQQSTGEIREIVLNPALPIKSGGVSWYER